MSWVDFLVAEGSRQLLRDPNVLFAGYRCPHPLKALFELKVRTRAESSPASSVMTAARDLNLEFKTIQGKFHAEVEALRNPSRQVFNVDEMM